MMRALRDIEPAVRAAFARLDAWSARPFQSLYRWAVPLALVAALCFALPPGAGFVVFAPFAAAFALKAVRVSRRIHRLAYVTLVVDEDGRATLDTEADRLQRAWVLGCVAIVALSCALLASRAAFAFVPGLEPSGSIALYLGFASVLVGGFLLCYYGALRLDSALLRGLASVTVTLPAFFVIVALLSVLLSWGMRIVAALGLSAESMIADGFAWVYDVQRVLGSATTYFVQQDAVVIGGSIVFAGAWVVDVQRWAAESESGQLAHAIDAEVLSSQAQTLAGYRTDDLIALVKAFVLPYTVGVFVANAVVAYRKAKAKRTSDAILDGFARTGTVDEDRLPEQEKRYLFYGGRRTLWDIALRSIGHDVPLPHPFAPRKLTWKERLTGELEDA